MSGRIELCQGRMTQMRTVAGGEQEQEEEQDTRSSDERHGECELNLLNCDSGLLHFSRSSASVFEDV